MKTIDVTPGQPNVVEIDNPTPIADSVFSGSFGGSSDILTMPIAEPIVLGTAVANVGGFAYRYDPGNPAHAYALAGIALTSAVVSQIVVIQPDGAVSIPGWNLTPGAVYHVGTNGALTTTPNLTAGHTLQTLGRAVNSNTLLLRPDDPISF